ncbi:hypothetical protein [Paenibacillus flagellatus]|uniref:BtrH N-terminal domain-containing protein n=1 Tax=Paenibacillus flagellatus TaxID=2211139 RepID=A0A2V5KCR8_9BACL|nr:hypothetical protein [Paenibacillus flagellatus]PYI55763.1 hypothetical protein DLM86_08570 [Paenibacillus flagellatus]
MGSVVLDIKMKRESKSFTDSLHAVLTAAGRFDGPKYRLSVLSGMAYKFTVHERLLPLSVTAYGQWGVEHGPAVDNLGVYTVWDGGRTRHPTFRYYQQDAVRSTKASLDRGVGAVYWIPEFGVIHGYDDGDRVFYVNNGWTEESGVLLYDNFGLNATPFWYVQWFGGKVEIDEREMTLESLRLALDDWETPYKTPPQTDIASGRLAYTYLMQGLARDDFDEKGAVSIVDAFRASRTEIRDGLRDLAWTLPVLASAAELYGELADVAADFGSCFAQRDGVRRVDRSRIGELIRLLDAALALEERAMRRFREISAEYPDPRRSVVPRWGAHIPR